MLTPVTLRLPANMLDEALALAYSENRSIE